VTATQNKSKEKRFDKWAAYRKSRTGHSSCQNISKRYISTDPKINICPLVESQPNLKERKRDRGREINIKIM